MGTAAAGRECLRGAIPVGPPEGTPRMGVMGTGDLFAGTWRRGTLRGAAQGTGMLRGGTRRGAASHPLLEPRWRASDPVLVGTSGFSFADWVGPFYPHGYRFHDMLPFYARQLPVVEVNATFYRIPPPATFAGMERRTPPGFRFIVKLHRVFTHQQRLDREAAAALRAGLEPLLAAGKLDGLLAQFPWSFRHNARNRGHLTALRRTLPEAPLFVEFRHASWAAAETWRLLRDHGLGYTIVDEPPLPGLMPPVVALTAACGYLRLHGRNAQRWWRGSGAERYDYRYAAPELRGWLPRLQALAARAEKVYVLFNNCHGGQAAQNAQLMQQLLGALR